MVDENMSIEEMRRLIEIFEKFGINQDKEKLKLFKNTKNYNWEIQLLEINIPRLREINEGMLSEFGGDISE